MGACYSVKELTDALVKTPKRKEWLRQPFPYSPDDSKHERRDKRDVYLYQVTSPLENSIPHPPGQSTTPPWQRNEHPCATPGSALTVPPCHRAGTRAGVHVSCARLTRLCGSQRTLPAPVVSTVLHGCHTRLEGDATFRRWWFVDAEGEIAGKLAAKIVKVRERKGSIYSSHSFLPSACWPV